MALTLNDLHDAAKMLREHEAKPLALVVRLQTIADIFDKRQLRRWRRRHGMPLSQWKGSLNREREIVSGRRRGLRPGTLVAR